MNPNLSNDQLKSGWSKFLKIRRFGAAYRRIIKNLPLEEVCRIRYPFRKLPVNQLQESDYDALHQILKGILENNAVVLNFVGHSPIVEVNPDDMNDSNSSDNESI